MPIVYSASGKIDLRASMAEEWKARRREQEREEAERNRLVICEICGGEDRAFMVRNPSFPICWRCSREGCRRVPWVPSCGDLKVDAAIDDLSAVVGLLWREARGPSPRV